jgi:hypothetical protein
MRAGRPRGWIALALVLALVPVWGLASGFDAAPELGDPVAWAFDWQAPAGCPERDTVVEAVHAYLPELDPSPPIYGSAELRVEVEIVADASAGWSARVRMSGRDGVSERRFSAPACAELGDAVALISAVALDPVLVARELASREAAVLDAAVSEATAEDQENTGDSRMVPDPSLQPRPDGSSDPVSAFPSSADPLGLDLVLSDPDDPDEPPRTVELGVGVAATGAWGPAAAGFGGVMASFAVFDGRWRWQLEGGYAPPRILALDDGRRGRVQAWWLGTRGCLVPSLATRSGRAIELPLCPGIEAGQVFARGLPPTTNVSRQQQPWAAVVVGQGLRWPVHEHLALTVEIAGLVALVRGRFLISDETFTTLTPVGVRGALGVEARF